MKIDKVKLKSAIPIDAYFQGQLGEPVKTNRNHWVYACPFHKDENTPNLAVYFDGGFKCFACDAKGGDVLAFHQKRNSLSFPQVLTELAGKYAPELVPNNKKGQSQKILAEYPYRDESEELLFQTVRYGPEKDFKQRTPDNNGGWVWGLNGTRRVPYRLPELLKSKGIVFIPGGEKDCETLAGQGFCATTNPCGEGNWLQEFNEYLKGRDVVILEDNDAKGQKHGQVVSQNLLWVASSIKIIRFQELPDHGDVTDYLENHSREELLERVEDVQLYKGEYQLYFNANPPVKSTSSSDKKKKPKTVGDENECKTQSQILIELAGACELFHNPEMDVFASILIDGHKETWPIRSKGFKRWLLNQFYRQEGKAPGAQALSDAMGVLEAKAQFDGPEHPVHVRIAEKYGNIYLNLCDKHCRVVEITPDGWIVRSKSPVKFIKPKGVLPLPIPVEGGSVDEIRRFINIEDEDGWKLFVATLISAFNPKGPYPVTVLQGEQGSSKSTTMRLKRSLIDPNIAALRTSPRESRDLMIYARNSWLLSFDNISRISPWLADDFCRLATGGGFATRELYSDNEQNIIEATRPIDLNGIEEIVTRDDLLDRSVIIKLPNIPEKQRKEEKTLWAEFHKAQPKILGALLDAVSSALKNHQEVNLESKPRMADFAKWVTAAETGLGWESGSFLKAYTTNRASAIEMGIEASPVAQAIQDLMEPVSGWKGTATELLDELYELTPEKITRTKDWPKAPQALSNRLRRLAPTLRSIGIDICFGKKVGHKRKRVIEIRKVIENSVRTVRNDFPNGNKKLGADDTADDEKNPASATNSLGSKGGDDADTADDDLQLFSNPINGENK